MLKNTLFQATFKTTAATFVGFAVLAGCATAQVSVKVSKYPKAPADSVLDDALKNGSSSLILDPGKAKCGLGLQLDPNGTGSLPLKLANVRGTADFEAVCRSKATINIVRYIQACSDSDITNGSILGCTSSDGCAVLAWDDHATDNAGLLLHEYGHVMGLIHIDGDHYLMKRVLDDNQFTVPDFQCDQIKGQSVDGTKPKLTLPQSENLTPGEFVRRQYIHGLPLGEARKFDAKDMGEIRDMLQNPKQERYWPNIVMVLGVAGQDQDAEALVKFLERKPANGEKSYRAKLAVPVALGYLAARVTPAHGKEYLKRGVHPEFWKQKGMRLSEDDSVDESAEELAKTSILALSVVQEPDVHQFLERLQLDRRPFFRENHLLIERSLYLNSSKIDFSSPGK